MPLPQHPKSHAQELKEQAQASSCFTSKKALRRVPADAAQTLYFTATSTDLDFRHPAEGEGLQENFLRIHDMLRRDNKFVKPPEVPLLTRNSLTYYVDFRKKPSADLDFNRQLATTKKEMASGRSKAPAVVFSEGTTYAEDFQASSPDVMKKAKLPPQTLKPASRLMGGGRSIVTTSHAQDTHCGPLPGMSATSGPVRPTDELEVSRCAPDFWRSSYRVMFSGDAGDAPQRQTRRRRKGLDNTRQIDNLLDDMGQTLRKSFSAPDLTMTMTLPVSMIGGWSSPT